MTSALREITKGFFAQLHVIHALILRETRTRFGKYSLGYIWAFVEPLSTMALFLGMFAVGKRNSPAGMDPVGFLATGFMPYYIFSGCMGKTRSAVSANKGMLYYPQVFPVDLVAARATLETITLSIVFFFMMLMNTIYTQHLPLESALQTLAGLGMAAFLGTGLGLIFCAISIAVPVVDNFISPLMRPMFWISGLFFSVNELPGYIRDILLWNPVLHIVDFTRDGWYQNYDSPYHSYTYVLAWILGTGFLGLFLERLTRRRIGS